MTVATASRTWEEAVQALLADPAQRQLVRDCFYDEPRAAAAERYRCSPEWQALLALLPRPPGRALEIGAGHGIASVALAGAGWAVTALEPDPSELVGAGAIRRLAGELHLDVRVVEGYAETLPFADGEFDLVLARQVLHHARNLRQLCRELARVVRPGGTVLAVREHVISSHADLPKFLAAHPLHHLYGGEHAYLRDEYRAALLGAGLRIVRELGPFDSAINYAPHTRQSLRDELARRAGRVPGGGALLRGLLASDRACDAFLRMLSRIDGRPGRLYSFVCTREVHS
jgi:SAM-dependent methyltransferase